jgi:hypothetical protein
MHHRTEAVIASMRRDHATCASELARASSLDPGRATTTPGPASRTDDPRRRRRLLALSRVFGPTSPDRARNGSREAI